jgi:preprotein translocase subunit SecD
MTRYFFYPCFTAVVLLVSSTTYGESSEAEEKAVEIENYCRQPNGKAARAPQMRGMFIGGTLFGPSDIRSAYLSRDKYTEEPVVSITFSPMGAIRFGDLTTRKQGFTMPMFLDGVLISCPIINEPIVGGQAQISGGFSVAEAAELVSRINRYTQ